MENYSCFLPFTIILIFLLLERRKQKNAATHHNIKKKNQNSFKRVFLIIYKPKRQASLKACLQSEIPVPTNEDFRSG